MRYMDFVNNMSSSDNTQHSGDFDFCSLNKLNKHVELDKKSESSENETEIQQSTAFNTQRLQEINIYCLPTVIEKNDIDECKNLPKYRIAKSQMEESSADTFNANLSSMKNKTHTPRRGLRSNTKKVFYSQQLTSKYNKETKSVDFKKFNDKNDCGYFLSQKKVRINQKYESVLSGKSKEQFLKNVDLCKANTKIRRRRVLNRKCNKKDNERENSKIIKNTDKNKIDPENTISKKTEPVSEQNSNATEFNSKINQIKNRLSELHEKMELSLFRQLSIPINKNVLDIKKRYALARCSFLVLDTNAACASSINNKSSKNTVTSVGNKSEKEIQDAQVQTSMICENVESEQENIKQFNDISIMANVSIENEAPKENQHEVTFKENDKNRKVVESIVLNLLEMNTNVIEKQKKIFEDCIDYVVKEVDKRLSKNTTKDSENHKKQKVSYKSRIPIKIKKTIEVQKKVVDKPEQNIIPENKKDNSLECLTQTVKATLEDLGMGNNIQQSLPASVNSVETNWNGFNNAVVITSTPLESNYTAQEIRNLHIMKKKINEMVSQKAKYNANLATKPRSTKQITLTQTFKMQKKNTFQNRDFYVWNKTDKSDDIVIDCDESIKHQTELSRIWAKLDEWKKDDDPVKYGVEYEDPWIFHPDEMVQVVDSQEPSVFGLPCNQEAFKN